MLDSVVDSFFPVLAQIDKEVDQIEKVLYSEPAISGNVMKAGPTTPKPSSDSTSDSADEKDDDASTNAKDEKPFSPIISQQRIKTAKFRAPPLPVSLHIRRARRFLKSLFSNTSTATGAGEPWTEEPANPATRTVYRMAKIRRLVTTLTRLLSTKADLIGQIQKRLVTRGELSLDSDPELYIHMGDILGQQLSHTNSPILNVCAPDHILTLQQALAHHEWTLAQSHPIYLTQLDVQAAQTKAGRGKAAVILAVVGVAVVLEGVPIGEH
jgi:magnesium transporter